MDNLKESKEKLKNLILNLICSGNIEEDAIFVAINSNMIKNGKLFGFECKVPSVLHLSGQAVLRKYGNGSWKRDDNYDGLEFHIGFFFSKDEYRDCVSKDIDHSTALDICDKMISLRKKIYDANNKVLW